MTSPAHPMHGERSLDTGHAASGLIAHGTPGARIGEARVEVGENTHIIAIRPLGNSAVEVEAEAEDRRPELLIELDLGAAVAYWHPGRRSPVALPADWLPSTFTSLVHSAPLGALYDDAGRVCSDGPQIKPLSSWRSRPGSPRNAKASSSRSDPPHPYMAG